MQQGDSYNLPLTVEDAEGNPITAANCYDFKVKVGDLSEKSYRAGTLNAETEGGELTGRWLYPISQAESLRLRDVTVVQAQVKYADGTVIGTPVSVLTVEDSIISTDRWED